MLELKTPSSQLFTMCCGFVYDEAVCFSVGRAEKNGGSSKEVRKLMRHLWVNSPLSGGERFFHL